MKKIIFLTFLGFLLCQKIPVLGQPSCSPYTGPMVNSFTNWDWTIVSSSANYCATWAVNQTNHPLTVVNAPWYSPKNGTFTKIYLDQDYTKDKGWELLRMDFGARVAIDLPYFILYNKYRSTVRAFFYLDNSAGTYTNGATIMLSHNTANSSSSSILSLSQPLALAPDAYLQKRGKNDEYINYVCTFTGQSGWVVADFPVTFDPNTGNTQYSASSLQFSVGGVVNSSLKTTGAFNFKTDSQVSAGGYAVAGTASTSKSGTSTLQTYSANTGKILTAVGSNDFSSYLDALKKKSDAIASSSLVPPATKTQYNGISQVLSSGGTFVSTLTKIADIAGPVGAFFGLVGTVIGVLAPDDTSPFTPTVSNGSLSLKGSITTNYPLTGATIQVPGSQHYFPNTQQQTDGGNQPYYDCPLGIFNIKNTPTLDKFNFNYAEQNFFYNAINYDSYQVSNDITAAFNDAAGLSLKSVQAAIIAEVPIGDFIRSSGSNYTNLNFLQQQVYSGKLEVIAIDSNKVTCATPFLNLGDFKGEAITTTTNARVYVRIKAVLQRKNAGEGASLIDYVQDYAIQVNSTTTAANPRYTTFTPGDGNVYSNEPPFTNLASALLRPYKNYGTNSDPFTDNTPYIVSAGHYTSPLVLTSLTTINAGTLSSGDVILDHPTTNDPSIFTSTTSIELVPGFSVTTGTNFEANTPIQSYKQGRRATMTQAFTGPCSYNSNTQYNPVAYRRPGTKSDPNPSAETNAVINTDELVVTPNPTDGIVSINIAVVGKTEATLAILDYMGREISRITSITPGISTHKVNLAGKDAGLYIFRLVTSNQTLTQKVSLR